MTIVKQSEYTGEASVKLVDEDDTSLLLNKIIIDLTDGAEPVKIIKYEGVPLLSGSFIEGIKAYIIDTWQDELKGKGIGIFKVSSDGVEKV
jgi:hypothetical protein